MTTIHAIDVAIGQHYKALNVNYDRKFSLYCEQNAIDDEYLHGDLAGSSQDSILVEFDPQFPFGHQPKDEQNKHKAIHQLLKCYYNEYIIPILTQDFFKIKIGEMEEFTQKFASQCPIYYKVLKTFRHTIKFMAMENKHKFDFLIHSYDMYQRDRLEVFNNTAKYIDFDGWIWKHLKSLKKIHKIHKTKTMYVATTEPYDMVRSALFSMHKRVTQLLRFESSYNINDSLEITVRYICVITDWINHINKASKGSVLPFHIDVCIDYGEPISIIDKAEEDSDVDDDDFDDDDGDSDDSYDDDKAGDTFVDVIGDIKRKLETNRLKYKHIEYSEYLVTGWLRSNAIVQHIESVIVGLVIKYFGGNLFNLFEEFIETFGDGTFPKYKRFVAFIDRRKRSQNIDDLWVYECPRDCSDIPQDAVSLRYFEASKTCVLPGVTVSSKGGSLLTFSFHVKSKHCIRCYLHYNGQMIRFMPQDIMTVLPHIFCMEISDNKRFVKNDELTKEMIRKMNEIVIDRQFDAFCERYSAEK